MVALCPKAKFNWHAMCCHMYNCHAAAPRPKPLNNAYMLVYIRLSDWDHIMRDTGKEELEPHVRAALEAQLVEKDAKRRRKMQAHRFVSFQVITLKDMQTHVRS
jgi:hypothetical protein